MHNEKLQTADTSFKTHEQLHIFEQPVSQLFYEQHLLLTVEKIHKNILKNIKQEHRFRNLNTLTVNETQLKMKQFPFNICSFNHTDTFHISLSPAGKNAVFYCKTKQFLLQVNGLQVFPGKKSFSKFYFQIFKLQLQTTWAAPQTSDLSVPQCFIFLYLFCACL